MTTLRRHLRICVATWLVFQVASPSALVPRDCCAAHRPAPSEKEHNCHEQTVAPHCPTRAADDTPCRAGECIAEFVKNDEGQNDNGRITFKEFRERLDRGLYHASQRIVAFMRGDFHGAAREGEATVSLDPKHARARNLVGAARASLGDLSAAREAFAAAIAIDPQDPSPYVNLGRLHLQTGQADAAAAVFSAPSLVASVEKAEFWA